MAIKEKKRPWRPWKWPISFNVFEERKMGNRSLAREQALQVLYFIDLATPPADQALDLFRANFEFDESEGDFVRSLVVGVNQHQMKLDELIEENSDNWRLSRMPRIDRNILRMGAYELTHCSDIPHAVAIDEAVELGKKFGEAKTPAFVNGILDRISKVARLGT
jgi:N utilization substance protein B